MKTNHNNFLKLAFNIAKVNLGKTRLNPSVGCVVVKNNSVISSGYTSLNGRPHAEFNALKSRRNFKNSDLYVTMEPCTHYGVTPPCTNIIAKKGIKRVFFSFNDTDKRTAKKLKKKLAKKKIKVYKKPSNDFHDFYQSYFLTQKNIVPFIDAKIATSKDYFTINKKSKWITNSLSRSRVHLIRSEYDAIISTSKSINKDNSLLNCRLNGFNNNKPDLVIIDLNLKIKKKLNLFKKTNKRKIFIVTSVSKGEKISYLKKVDIKIIPIKSLKNKNDFIDLFKILKKYGYNRILVESGLIFLNELLKNKLIFNLYMFQSPIKLGKKGKNNTSNNIIKKLKLKKKIKVNLNGENLYKVKIK
jgi:diaminohydroxyphosphoribosylaminopyrimidine deaminase/5-amino-6-(5-phosphoribosylamino)uracil reductase